MTTRAQQEDAARAAQDARMAQLDRLAALAETLTRGFGKERQASIIDYALRQYYEKDNHHYLRALQHLRHVPVTMEEFLTSREFFADQYEELWPQAKEDLLRINPDLFVGEEPIHEYYDGGAIGTAKSFKAMATQAYQLYVLCCFKSPQALYSLAQHTPLVFMFQSVSERVTRRVLFEPFRHIFTSMPWIKKNVAWDKYKETTLYLGNNIQIVPALANVNAMVGQAIISALLDEVNFMSVVARSVQVPGADGQGGHYDQAEIAYRQVARRRNSRFITQGPSPGTIALLSSVRYKSDFLDRRIEDAIKYPNPNRLWFRRKQYEVQPAAKYVKPRFRVLVGSDLQATRLLTDRDVAGESYPANAEVLDVPGEFMQDFRTNPDEALRDVCGIASAALSPFITQRHFIAAAVERWNASNRQSWVDNREVELLYHGMPQIAQANLPLDKDAPRYIHVDLAKSRDRCGIAIVTVPRFSDMPRSGGHIEHLPYFVVEDVISIQPSTSRELDITEVRNWIMLLKTFYKYNIQGVTYDGFQSQESITAWRKSGIWSEDISMDRTSEPYEVLKSALYDNRCELPDSELLRLELSQLEYNRTTDKIDHPPRGSKDVSDAVAGACYAAYLSRRIRSQIRVTTPEGQNIAGRGRSRSSPSRPRE